MESTKRFNVLISQTFDSMLTEHIAFIARQSPAAAKRTQKKIVAAVASLSTMPERHPFFSDLSDLTIKHRKFYVEDWYLILYHIVDATVYVDTILDCRQDPSWLHL